MGRERDPEKKQWLGSRAGHHDQTDECTELLFLSQECPVTAEATVKPINPQHPETMSHIHRSRLIIFNVRFFLQILCYHKSVTFSGM